VIPAALALAALTSIHFPVTTHDAQAQALVDRGLFLYYAYDGGDSAAAFAAAARRDPQLAMARWGEALAAGPDLNTPITAERFAAAQTAAQAAVALESGADADERAYVDAMALRYRGTWADWASDDVAYLAAMSTLSERGSSDAKMLTAEGLLERGGLGWEDAQLGSADSRQALALVDAVLAADPGNLMANHLCVHLYDRVPDRAPAQTCAQRLDAAAFPPQAEHLAHMPAHYWIETGNYAAAVASSERAYRLFLRWQHLADRDPEHDRYLAHDVYVGYSAAMMLGNYPNARIWAARMTAAFESPYDALTALRFGHFAEVAALPADSTPAGLAVRGYAGLMLGDAARAHAIAKSLHPTASSGYIVELFLARLAEADGRFADATGWIDRAVDAQHAAFEGELIPLLPALEARAGLSLRRGIHGDAADAYRAVLATYPGDPRAFYGLASALEPLGDRSAASDARDRFVTSWSGFPAPPFLL
jgi:hypothetical protein